MDRFDVLLRALFETFGQTPTAGQLMGYRMALDDIDPADLEKGIRRAMNELKFLPKPVELRELSGEMSMATRAALAWGAAKKAVHSLSAYSSPDFEDPVINAVIRNMGGWVDFCGRDAETFETFTRKDFERIYQSFGSYGVSAEMAAPLRGIHSEEREKRVLVGYPVEKRRLSLAPDSKLGGLVGMVIDKRAKG